MLGSWCYMCTHWYRGCYENIYLARVVCMRLGSTPLRYQRRRDFGDRRGRHSFGEMMAGYWGMGGLFGDRLRKEVVKQLFLRPETNYRHHFRSWRQLFIEKENYGLLQLPKNFRNLPDFENALIPSAVVENICIIFQMNRLFTHVNRYFSQFIKTNCIDFNSIWMLEICVLPITVRSPFHFKKLILSNTH